MPRAGPTVRCRLANQRVHRTTDKVIVRGVPYVEFYSWVESDEFDQVSLAFIRFFRRSGLRKSARKKNGLRSISAE